MSIAKLSIGLIFVFSISMGQILFKLGALNITEYKGIMPLVRQCINKYFIISIFIYMIATVLWIWLLRSIPLKQAYPLVALAFLFVPVLARFFLNEALDLKSVIGGLIIFLGVYVSVA